MNRVHRLTAHRTLNTLHFGIVGLIALAGLLLPTSATLAAGISIPQGSAFYLGGGSADLGCGNLVVGGEVFAEASALQNIDTLNIAASGNLDGGSAEINVSGDWNNAGSFVPGTSTVLFSDGCQPITTITGNNTFYDLTFSSTVGKTFQIAAGSLQTVLHALQTIAPAGTPLILASTIAGTYAQILLGPDATADTENSTSTWINLQTLAMTPVPTLSNAALALLAAGLFWIGLRRQRSIRPIRGR